MGCISVDVSSSGVVVAGTGDIIGSITGMCVNIVDIVISVNIHISRTVDIGVVSAICIVVMFGVMRTGMTHDMVIPIINAIITTTVTIANIIIIVRKVIGVTTTAMRVLMLILDESWTNSEHIMNSQ